jgi:hypothetical protein
LAAFLLALKSAPACRLPGVLGVQVNQEYPGRVVPLTTLKLVSRRGWGCRPAAAAILLVRPSCGSQRRDRTMLQYDELGYRVHMDNFHGHYVSPLEFKQYTVENMKAGSLLNIYLTRKSRSR